MTETNIENFFGPRIKQNTKEQLYESVRIYLEARIKYPGNPKLENGFLYELFAICEKEILKREEETSVKLSSLEIKGLQYLQTFGDLLARAGLDKKHPFDITKLN